ncbi:restriction endonuclease subunit S [Vibrio sp. 1-Bac 57]
MTQAVNSTGINSVPKGYKWTEVGVLPDDWVASPISKNMKLINGFGFKPHQWSLHGIPIIRIQNLNSEEAMFNYFEGKVDDKFHVHKGDLLFAWSGSKGSSFGARIWKGVPAILNQHIFRVVPNANALTPLFSFYILRQVQEQIEKMAHGFKSSFVHVKKEDLSSTILPIPPIKEQTAIANALSEVDLLLSELEKLMTKKQAIKTATMQQLLTGKTRLPQFAYFNSDELQEGELESKAIHQTSSLTSSQTTGTTASQGQKKGTKPCELGEIPEDWEVDKIGSVLSITTGSRNTQDKLSNGQYPFFVRSQTIEHINTYSFDGEAVLTAGDGVGTGKIFHYINGKFDYHQRVYLMHNFGERIDGYYFYIYFSNFFYDRIMSMTAKSSVDSVRREMIADMLISLPSKKEQTAIATILSDMDEEIQALSKRLSKTRQIKQGMMQELLTGKTRLPFEKSEVKGEVING